MTKIQDMTPTQRHSWLVLLADGAVFTWFWQKMTVGLSPVPIDYDMHEFSGIVVGIIILTVALHVVISIVFELIAKDDDTGRDERDIAIERRGAFWGYRILQIGLGVVVVGMLMSGAIGDDYQAPIQFSNPVQIIFGLIVTSYVADLVKHAVMIHGYGR
jgi:hypothetical protein